MKQALVLIGFKHCGKTSVGKLLAQKLAAQFVDTDELLLAKYAAESGQVVACSTLYRKLGESAFRALEKQVITQLTLSGPTVIATGGGVVLDPENVRVLRRLGMVIYLATPYEVLHARLQNQAVPAFMEDVETGFASLFQHRQALYRKLADRVWDTGHDSVSEIAEKLYQAYRGRL